MPTLILVRHSIPAIDPARSADQWSLSAEGRQRCAPLADRLAQHHPGVIVTSVEPKAVETARLVAERLGLPLEVAEGLHEHDRRGVPFESRAAFEAAVARFFAEPARLVFGNETADGAHARFAAAVAVVLARHPGENVAVVTHGTVMTLFVARANRLEPFAFWRQLGLPALVVLSRPGFEGLHVVENVKIEEGDQK